MRFFTLANAILAASFLKSVYCNPVATQQPDTSSSSDIDGADRLRSRQASRAGVVRMASRSGRLKARASPVPVDPTLCGGYVGKIFILDISATGPSPYVAVLAPRRGAVYQNAYINVANTQEAATRFTLTAACNLITVPSGLFAIAGGEQPTQPAPGSGLSFGPPVRTDGIANYLVTCYVDPDLELHCDGGAFSRGRLNTFTGGSGSNNNLGLTAEGAVDSQLANFPGAVLLYKPKVIQVTA